jgi:hypothetical protein
MGRNGTGAQESGGRASSHAETQGPVPQMNRPNIYQIYYREAQTPYLDSSFTPWFNTGNPRPEWREYWIYRTAQPQLDFKRYSHVGFVSWKFGQKCHVPGKAFVDFVERAPQHDVYFVNPAPHATYLYRSVWAHGEFHHPGMLAFVKSVFAKVHPHIKFDEITTPAEKGAFCNYWAGSERFWKLYMEFCEPVFDYLENKTNADERNFIYRVADPVIRTTYHSFIMERMFSTLLAVRPDISSMQYYLPDQALQEFYGHLYGEVIRARQLSAELEQIEDANVADRVRELFLDGFLGVATRQAEIDSLRSLTLTHILKRYLKEKRPRTYKAIKFPIKTLARLANR